MKKIKSLKKIKKTDATADLDLNLKIPLQNR